MRPFRLEHAAELMDQPGHDELELECCLDHLEEVNHWLGGRGALLRYLPPLLPTGRAAHILDVATGSADLPRAIVHWAHQNGRRLRITATDVHPQIVDLARRRCAAYPEIRVETADALELPYPDGAFDLALLSLALHHFSSDDGLAVLRELWRVTRRGILVNELERSWPNLLGARILAATVWRGNRMIRHDGPISVRRAFTPEELLRLARAAGLQGARVHRHFFQRLVLVADSSVDHGTAAGGSRL